MKKKQNKIIILICTVCILAGATLASVKIFTFSTRKNEHKKQVQNEEFVQTQIMDYLENRYHEKFVLKNIRFYSETVADKCVTVDAWPEEKEDDEHYFKVIGHINANKQLEYCDTYVDLRLIKELKEYIEPYINKYYDEYLSYDITFTHPDHYWSNLPANIKLERSFRYFNRVNPCIHLNLQTDSHEHSYYDTMEALAKYLKENDMKGTLEINYLNTDGTSYRTYSFNLDWEKEIVISGEIPN